MHVGRQNNVADLHPLSCAVPDHRLTPNGRFELNKKICLTSQYRAALFNRYRLIYWPAVTGYHEESWQPAWGIRTALVALMSFFHTEAKGAIGGLDTAPEERRRLALLSKDWCCPTCACKNSELLPAVASKSAATTAEAATSTPDAMEKAAVETPKGGATEATSIETIRAVPLSPSLSISPAAQTPDLPLDISAGTSAASHISLQPSSAPRGNTTMGEDPLPSSDTQGTSSAIDARLVDAQASIQRVIRHRPSESMQGSAASPSLPSSPTPASSATSLMRREAEALSPPPVWLDGMIGLVLVALASLLCRKIL